MKRKIAVFLMGTLLCAALAGCSGDAPTTAQDGESAEGGLNIRVILNTTASEYWGYVKAGAEAYGAENEGVSVEVIGPASETSYDEQNNLIETSLSSGQYDGLVLSAIQPDSVRTLIAGTELPIVAVNTRVDADEIISFVGTGNEEAAAEGARAAVEAA